MPKLIDLTGQRFGRWVVLKKAPPKPNGSSAYWLCECDCGTIKEVNGQQLRSGNSKSCGCYHYELLADATRTHGKSKTRLYNVWASMRERCYCKTSTAYKWYGEKGIGICEEWQDYSSFEKWALENGYDPSAKPHECSLDRIDGTKNYSPQNCRLANATIQANNTEKNIPITYNGKTQNISEWSREIGISYGTLYDRLFQYGWCVERALTEPTRGWSPVKCKNSA